MLRNYFKIAFRQIKKQKFYSAVNIMGLAIGVTCCLLITLYIQDELSYDQEHPNVDNLYRVVRDNYTEAGSARVTVTPPRLAQALVEEIPEVTMAARLNPYFLNAGSNLVRKENVQENQYEEKFVYADPEFLEMFHVPLVRGEKKTALENPNTLVISEKIARKYFSQQDPVGKIFILNNDNEQRFTITGVMENMPAQNHLQFDFLVSMSTLSDSYENPTWLSNSYYTYVTLADGIDPADLEEKTHDFIIKNLGPSFKEVAKMDLAQIHKEGYHVKFEFQPVTDIHLKSEDRFPQLQSNGDIRYVRLFGIIALFILIIALVNFVNLSTSRSANRAKEVGLRKVLGSFHQQLIQQFLSESVLMSLFAFIIGSAFAFLLLPYFNTFLGKELSFPITNVTFLLAVLGSALGAGLLAGLYPAFYLSKFQPAKVLKGKLSQGSKSGWLRSSLVVVQFAISIGLIVGTLVVKNQMDFIQNKKLGFDKDQVLIIQDTYTLEDQLPAFKDALKKLPEVKNATVTAFLPLADGDRSSSAFYLKGHSESRNHKDVQTWAVDEDYISTLSMNLIKGRDFSADRLADSTSVIINETVVKELNLGDDPIGKIIKCNGGFFDSTDYQVIGVVEDFHFESLRGEVQGTVLFRYSSPRMTSVKTTAVEMERLISKAESVWKTFVPTQPFRYSFLDERFAKMYETEHQAGTLFSIFSMLAIFIACLGLLALATFMTEQRMKEIGIRKVLGASVPNIVFQLSKKFLLYVLIGLLIAAPIAWIQMNNWLENFAYRIEMEWWMIALAGTLAISIAFLTVGSKTLYAALTNPVESLRNE